MPDESITTGLNTLSLRAITVSIPFLPGNKAGWLLEPGGKGMNFVGVETANGANTPAIDLLSNTNVTVCGSGTRAELYHVTLSPTLTSVFDGKNWFHETVLFPPPALTLSIIGLYSKTNLALIFFISSAKVASFKKRSLSDFPVGKSISVLLYALISLIIYEEHEEGWRGLTHLLTSTRYKWIAGMSPPCTKYLPINLALTPLLWAEILKGLLWPPGDTCIGPSTIVSLTVVYVVLLSAYTLCVELVVAAMLVWLATVSLDNAGVK